MRRLIFVSFLAAFLFANQLSFSSSTGNSVEYRHSVSLVSEWTEYVYFGEILYKITYHDDGSVTVVRASHITQGD